MLNSSPLTCPGEPLLEDALDSLPGFFLAKSISSLTEVKLVFGETASSM
jgi:hypothetical protein